MLRNPYNMNTNEYNSYELIKSFDPIQSNYSTIATYESYGMKQIESNQFMIPDYLYMIRKTLYEHGLYNAIPFIMSTTDGHIVCYRIDYYYPLPQIINEMSVYYNIPIGTIYKPILFSNHPISTISTTLH